MSDLKAIEKAQIAVPQYTQSDFDKLKSIASTMSPDEAALLEATLNKKIVKLDAAESDIVHDDVMMSAYALCFHIVENLRSSQDDDPGEDIYIPQSIVFEWIKKWDAIAERSIDLTYTPNLYKVEDPT